MGNVDFSVLVVDGDLESLWAIGRSLARGGFCVTTCADGAEAFSLVQSRDFRLVITEIVVGGAAGLSLIDWIRNNKPSVAVVAIADRGTPALKNLALGKGAIHYLEKPVDCELLMEVTAQAAQKGAFRGTIDDIGILDYVQLMLLCGKRLVLEVFASDGRRGALFIEDGRVCHAVCGSLEGDAAAYECLGFPGGNFLNRPWRDPDRTTIDKPGEFLLVEAARRKDEERGDDTEDREETEAF